MWMRTVAFGAGVALLSSVAFAWWRDGTIQHWLGSKPAARPAIVFDNGSVRDAVAPPASAPAQPATVSAPGVLRKCVRGSSVSYSNLECPAGYREKAVAADRVTVLPAVQAAAKPPEGQGSQPNGLREALGLTRDERLHQRMIDRAVEAEAGR